MRCVILTSTGRCSSPAGREERRSQRRENKGNGRICDVLSYSVSFVQQRLELISSQDFRQVLRDELIFLLCRTVEVDPETSAKHMAGCLNATDSF